MGKHWLLVAVGLAVAVGGLVLLLSVGGDSVYCGGYESALDPSSVPGPSCEDQANAAARAWWGGAALFVGGVVAAAFGLGFWQGSRVRRVRTDAAVS